MDPKRKKEAADSLRKMLGEVVDEKLKVLKKPVRPAALGAAIVDGQDDDEGSKGRDGDGTDGDGKRGADGDGTGDGQDGNDGDGKGGDGDGQRVTRGTGGEGRGVDRAGPGLGKHSPRRRGGRGMPHLGGRARFWAARAGDVRAHET